MDNFTAWINISLESAFLVCFFFVFLGEQTYVFEENRAASYNASNSLMHKNRERTVYSIENLSDNTSVQ